MTPTLVVLILILGGMCYIGSAIERRLIDVSRTLNRMAAKQEETDHAINRLETWVRISGKDDVGERTGLESWTDNVNPSDEESD